MTFTDFIQTVGHRGDPELLSMSLKVELEVRSPREGGPDQPSSRRGGAW